MKLASVIGAFVLLLAGPRAAQCAGAPAADPHQQLQQILHRPMYQAWRSRELGGQAPNVKVPSRLRDWVSKPFTWIRDWLKRLFWRRSNGGPGNSGLSSSLPVILKLLAWIAVTLAVVFCAIIVFRLINPSGGAANHANVLSREQVHDALQSGDALALGTAQWMDEARRLAMERNFRAVYRALYLALLSGLHAAGKIEHSRNRTNWTYVNQYRGPAIERTTFSELTELFDRVWYGRKEPEGANLEDLQNQINSLTAGGRA